MTRSASQVAALSDILLAGLDRGDWMDVLDRMTETIGTLRKIQITHDPSVVPARDAPVILAAAIDKLEDSGISSAAQAYVWGLSAKPLHRALAEAWTFAHSSEHAAFERELAELQAKAILGGISLHERAESLLPAPKPRTVHFTAFRNEDAGVWTASSDDDIATEADTQQALQLRLSEIVPDLLESREGRIGPLTIVIDWQGPQTAGQTTFAVA